MNLSGPFKRSFWVDENYVEPLDNVVHLNTPHARAHAQANAAQAAMLLEGDRSAMRYELRRDLVRERNRIMGRVQQIDAALMELDGG